MNRFLNVFPFLVIVVVIAFLARRRRGTTRRAPLRLPLPSLGVTGLVAGREVRQRMHGRAFRIATALVLLGVAAAIVIPSLAHGTSRPQRVGVVGTLSSAARTAVESTARSIGTDVTFHAETSAAAAESDLRGGHLDLAVVDGREVIVHKAISSGNTTTTAQLARAVSRSLGTVDAITAAHLSPAQVAALSGATPLPVRSLEPAKTSSAAQASAITELVVVFVMLSQYLTWTLTGVMEEKSNRISEVLLAAVRPVQLLAGKVIGIAVVVLAQAAIIAGFALVLAKSVGSDLLHGAGPASLAGAFVWLVLGYAFYSWAYAAAGSMVERQDQVQSLAIPLMLPMLFGYIFGFTTIGAGHASLLAQVLAYLPPTAPFSMPVLVALGAASWWQFTLSALISIVSTIAMARLAALVYRRAILRTGGRVRLREVLRRAPGAV